MHHLRPWTYDLEGYDTAFLKQPRHMFISAMQKYSHQNSLQTSNKYLSLRKCASTLFLQFHHKILFFEDSKCVLRAHVDIWVWQYIYILWIYPIFEYYFTILKSIFRVHCHLSLYLSLKLQLYEQVVHLPGIEYAALYSTFSKVCY